MDDGPAWSSPDPFPPHDGDNGGGGGGGGSGGGGDGDPDVDDRIRSQIENWLSGNSPREAIGQLLRDNFDQRDELRDLREEVRELRGQVPGEDAVVLEGEEADAFQELRERGGDLEDLQEAVQERDQLREDLANRERQDRIQTAADAHGLSAAALTRLVEQDGVDVTVEEEEEDGETVQVAYIQNGDGEDGGDPVPLQEYAEEEWAEFLPALQAEGSGGSGGSGGGEGGSRRRFAGSPGQASGPDRSPTVEDEKENLEKRGTYRL